MSTSDKSSSNPQPRERSRWFLGRLILRFPWLKIVLVLPILAVILLDLFALTISRTSEPEPESVELTAPMSRHVRAADYSPKGKKLVALTFDDGPSAETTPRLLDILKKYEVSATFFMLGTKVRSNPDIVRRAEKEGHEIATHTLSHQNLIRLSSGAIKADLDEAKAAITSVLGHGPSCLRPPYGNFNESVKAYAGVPIILWSVDTLDWKYRNTESIVKLTMEQVSDGGVILMHDIHPTSVDAVPTLIYTLRKSGYEFVTISELAKLKGTKLTSGTAYYSIR